MRWTDRKTVGQDSRARVRPPNRQEEQRALALCQSKIRQKKLQMEVFEAEYQWDRRKLTYYFSAAHRIDFRELVRELFKVYKTRIWMCAIDDVDGKRSTPAATGASVNK